jgi:hypothetical protein
MHGSQLDGRCIKVNTATPKGGQALPRRGEPSDGTAPFKDSSVTLVLVAAAAITLAAIWSLGGFNRFRNFKTLTSKPWKMSRGLKR